MSLVQVFSTVTGAVVIGVTFSFLPWPPILAALLSCIFGFAWGLAVAGVFS